MIGDLPALLAAEASEIFAVVGPLVGLAGVVVGWLLASRTARRLSETERHERRRGELLTAVVAYWHELERLENELRQLPMARKRMSERMALERVPWLGSCKRFLAEREAIQAARWILGPGAAPVLQARALGGARGVQAHQSPVSLHRDASHPKVGWRRRSPCR